MLSFHIYGYKAVFYLKTDFISPQFCVKQNYSGENYSVARYKPFTLGWSTEEAIARANSRMWTVLAPSLGGDYQHCAFLLNIIMK